MNLTRKNGRNNGEVFTSIEVVKYILDEVNFKSEKDLSNIKLLEPASGEGVFAIEIIKRLFESSINFNFNFLIALNNNIKFIELNKVTFEKLKTNVTITINKLGYSSEKISNKIFIKSDYLKINSFPTFDCIVGNPPYIRHEDIDKESKELYKINFSTFRYRADLYIPFYEHSLNYLSNNGKLSFICSNRWLYNQYGKLLRNKVAENFHLLKILNIENTSPFDENVSAYPCITTIENKKADVTLYYETNSRHICFSDISFINKSTPKNSYWQNLFLNYDINHSSLKGIEEQNFKIGIGVATGADNIFILKELKDHNIEKSRLLPLIKANALKNNSIKWDGSYIINPFENNSLCDLNKYPNLKKYFHKHKNKLLQRYISKKNPSQWYKTIDKIKTSLINEAKLLLPDLAGGEFLFIDEGNYYPHHNIYYITSPSIDELKILASILMSNFIKNQLSQIGIRMNGGLPRFQTQTLKKLCIPNISKFNNSSKLNLIEAYNKKELKIINDIVDMYCKKQGFMLDNTYNKSLELTSVPVVGNSINYENSYIPDIQIASSSMVH
jgi:hypothetical protein